MTLGEQLQYIAALQRSHDEQIGRLIGQANRNGKPLDVLTERSLRAMDAINHLAHDENRAW